MLTLSKSVKSINRRLNLLLVLVLALVVSMVFLLVQLDEGAAELRSVQQKADKAILDMSNKYKSLRKDYNDARNMIMRAVFSKSFKRK